MFVTIFETVIGDSLTPDTMLAVVAVSLLLGFMISLVYTKTHRKKGYQSGFAITLVMLPVIICVIIALIGNNVARAFSLAGAFSLIRFRSAPGDPKDISYVFFTLGVGLACGMGYLAYAALFSVGMCAVMMIIDLTNFASPKSTEMQLRISIPEDLNFQGLFNDILDRYTTTWSLKRIKTSEFGTLFEVSYNIDLKNDADQKMLIDELRCRNGNLNILLTLKEYEAQVPTY
ncbi:MAG: DUF4956 domain-containing protein [bacterium]